jgi:RimJ/RimL family protein N-acetyltransferase
MYRRFISPKKGMPHQELQEYVVLDYTKGMAIVASVQQGGREEVVGLAQYGISQETHMAEVAFIVSDEHQNRGIGTELLGYMTYLAKRQGLLGFTAEVLMENRPMLHVFEKMGFDMQKSGEGGVYELRMLFKEAHETVNDTAAAVRH